MDARGGPSAQQPGSADQAPRRRKPNRYRLTRSETIALLETALGSRARRAVYLGTCAGLRRSELRGVQGRHFRRAGWVWVSADFGKGGKERWIPVISDLQPVWAEISRNVADDEYVLPAQRFRDPGRNRDKRDYTQSPASYQAIWNLVKRTPPRRGSGRT